jgi:WD40 repeat protein/serine/threonine protein kinase
VTDSAPTHPTTEELLAYASGQLAEDRRAAVERHLSSCPVCRMLTERSAAESVRSGPTVERNAGLPVPLALPVGAVPAALLALSKYQVLRLLGAGGMGTVYLADHRVMNRRVALKVIHARFTSNPTAVERFHREIQAASRLQHPNIVTAHDADQAGDVHFLVMEFVEGRTLAAHLREQGPLPIREACDYARQTALGLQHAHEKGMVHRDIKPDNLMLSPAGPDRGYVVKILDFGLARLGTPAETNAATCPAADAKPGFDPADVEHVNKENGTSTEPETDLTAAGVVMGTPDYMAPEQGADSRTADIRADIYSLGCTLYRMLTGKAPFAGRAGLVEKVRRHREEQARPLRELRPEVPAALAAVVEKMLAKDPTARYQAPGEAAEALGPFAEPPRRRHALVGLVAGLLLALIAGVAVYRARTDVGEILLESEDPAVEVVIRQGQHEVRVVDTSTARQIELPSGEYDLEVRGGPEGLRLKPERVTLTRGQTVQTAFERPPRQPPPPPKIPWPPMDPVPVRVPSPQELADRTVPADALARSGITPLMLAEAGGGDPAKAPAELVAVLAEERFRVASGSLGCPALSPEGDLVAACSHRDVFLFDAKTGRLLRTLSGHTGDVQMTAFSPDGRLLVSAGHDRTIRVWDSGTGELLKTLSNPTGGVSCLAFCRAGRTLISGGQDLSVRLWDMSEGKEPRLLGAHDAEVVSVALNPDGVRAASAAADGSVRVWDCRAGQSLADYQLKPNRPVEVAFSSDGKLLAIGGANQVVVRESTTFEEVWHAASRANGLLAFTPDGKHLLTGPRVLDPLGDQQLTRRDAATGKVLGSFHAAVSWKEGPGNRFHLGPDGRTVVVQCGGSPFVRLCDAETGKARFPDLDTGGFGYTLALHPDGGSLAVASSFGTIRLWSLATGRMTGTLKLDVSVGTIQFSPDGRVLAGIDAGHIIYLWDPATGELLKKISVEGNNIAVGFHPAGRVLATGGSDGTIRLWDTDTSTCFHTVKVGKHLIQSLVFSPDGRQLAFTEVGKGIQLREVGEASPQQVWSMRGPTQVAFLGDGSALVGRSLTGPSTNSLLFRPGQAEPSRLLILRESTAAFFPTMGVRADGRLLAVADAEYLCLCDPGEPSDRGRIRRLNFGELAFRPILFTPEMRYLIARLGSNLCVLRLADRGTVLRPPDQVAVCQERLQLRALGRGPAGVNVSAEGSEVVTADRGAVHRWNARTGELVGTHPGLPDEVPAAALAADGRHLLFEDGTGRTVWHDFVAGRTLWTFPGTLLGPPDRDGATAATGTLDGLVSLWNLRTGELGQTLAGHAGRARCARLSPDGTCVLTVGEDRTVRIWDVGSGEELYRLPDPVESDAETVFDPAGGRFALAHEDHTVWLHDAETGRGLYRLPLPDPERLPGLPVRELHVRKLAFTPDSKRLLIAVSSRGNLASSFGLWDLERRQLIEDVRTTLLTGAAFTPDGLHLATGHNDGLARVWRLPDAGVVPGAGRIALPVERD